MTKDWGVLDRNDDEGQGTELGVTIKIGVKMLREGLNMDKR